MPKIGLILSGGMAKGAYQIGALQALSEYLKPEDIQYISSSSVGVVNGYAFATGNLEQAKQMWLSLNDQKKKVFITTVYKNALLKETIKATSLQPPDCRHFYASILHLKKGDLLYWDIAKEEDPIRRSRVIRASIAFPPFTGPIEIDGNNYYDGALVDNIPVKPLLKHAVDYVICMYFDSYDYTFESEYFDNKVVKLNFEDKGKLLAESLWMTREGLTDMMERGYKQAKVVFDFVFQGGVEDVENIYERIEMMNAMHPERKTRLTGDVVVNNFNKLAKRFAKRTIVK